MRISRTSARAVVPAVVLALAMLSACGDDDSTKDEDSSTSASPSEAGTSSEEPREDSDDDTTDDSSQRAGAETDEDSSAVPGAVDPAESRLCKAITAQVVSDVFGAKASPAESRTGCAFMMLKVGSSMTVAEAAPSPGQDLQAGFERARKNAPGKAEDLPDLGDDAFISVKESGDTTLVTAMMPFGDGLAIFSASDTRPGVKEKVVELMERAHRDGS